MTTTKAVGYFDRSTRAPRPPSVERLRASPEIEDMLDWYFTRAGHDLAMGSNFEMLAQMARMGLGGGGDADAFETRQDRISESVHRYRQVRALLGCLTTENLDVLSARYELRQWPVELVQAFGRSTGVAVRTGVARRLYLRDSLKKRARWESVSVWLCGVVRRCERDTLAQVRLETEAYEARAIASFESIVSAASHAKAS